MACKATLGLVLHVDPAVKQLILDLDSKHSNQIVIHELVVRLPADSRKYFSGPELLCGLQGDHGKIFVNETFEDNSGNSQNTTEWLLQQLDIHLGQISFKPESHNSRR